MSSTQIIITAVVIIVVLVVVAIIATMAARRRALKQRFGPEYDRVVDESDSRLAAERELRDRERRHAELELRPLSDGSRARYAADWERIQARFVDSPNDAVREADDLVTRLVAERGYPTGDYDEQVAHLSVEHARVLDNYRNAHEINTLNTRGEATTEQLRQAVVYYRALFAELIDVHDHHALTCRAAVPTRTATLRRVGQLVTVWRPQAGRLRILVEEWQLKGKVA